MSAKNSQKIIKLLATTTTIITIILIFKKHKVLVFEKLNTKKQSWLIYKFTIKNNAPSKVALVLTAKSIGTKFLLKVLDFNHFYFKKHKNLQFIPKLSAVVNASFTNPA